MLVFIDESGDPGFKLSRGSSDVFVAALVAFQDAERSMAAHAAIDGLARRSNLTTEFKFNKSRHIVRDAFFEAVQPCDFRVRAIVVQKERIYSAHLRTHKEAFYSFFVRSMLTFDRGLLQRARVIIDGSGDREFKRELSSYLRRQLEPGVLHKVRFNNSANDRLVQLADMCAGAIARSYRIDRDSPDRWLRMLRPKIDDVWVFR
jgi:Protein of unknown function (DUF3800)